MRTKIALAAMLLWQFLSAAQTRELLDHRDRISFMDSFVQSYELAPEGRYTHEYHPFLLKYTAQSLAQLEGHLSSAGLNLDGRLVIMGYEEQAMPQYFTDFEQERINDEAMRKNNTGWSQKLHNRFGFMTGFLFKQIEKIQQHMPGVIDDSFQHIDAGQVHLFQDGSAVLQEHAFGETLPFLISSEEYILELLCKKDSARVLSSLERFWQMLYTGKFRVGNQEVAGTQDVLFSIEYIKHLQRSPLPMHHFFTGPDISYPIEVTQKQGAGATRHAQHFVEEFVKKLLPVNNEPTVYIFCSFVDGVGKSTMLGNVKNWMRHGSDIAHYGSVDNSSSQLAELFPFAENVFIADLPAQISHFTYKPDGFVFVDVGTEFDAEKIATLRSYAVNNMDELIADYNKKIKAMEYLVADKGHFASELINDPTPHALFLSNVILLGKKSTNRWIPFMHNDKPYLVNNVKPYEIRCLIPLGHVRSEGLKNIESEQMLFTAGIRFPYRFDYFMDDLTTRLQSQAVKHIRFVDFLSMYPRSQRENTRINYLLQQMAHLFPGFTPQTSLYKEFVSGGELLHALMTPAKSKFFLQSFRQEALTRYALFKNLCMVDGDPLVGLTIKDLTTTLRTEIEASSDQLPVLQESIKRKMLHEQEALVNVYGMSKAFINTQLLSLPQVIRFSKMLSNLFTNEVIDEFSQQLWEDAGMVHIPTAQVIDGERFNARDVQTVITANGQAVRPLFLLNAECRNADLLAPAIRMMRACWYSQILNLFYADNMNSEGHIELNHHWYRGIPLQFVRTAEQPMTVFALVQPSFTACAPESIKATQRPPFKDFEFQSYKSEMYSKIEDSVYRVDWDMRATQRGLFGFDSQLQAQTDSYGAQKTFHNIVTTILQKHQNETSVTTVMPTSDLWKAAKSDRWWKVDCQSLQRTARENGFFDTWLVKCYAEGKLVKPTESWRKQIYVLSEARKPLAQLVVRLLATLEMVLKDLDADVVIRHNHEEDFKAAIQLIETLVLPNYVNACIEGPLFDDYDAVEPYPSWSHWRDED